MAVYVDDMRARVNQMIMCHMWADTPGELMKMAWIIGVNHKWLQAPPGAQWVHFDISLGKRALALGHGALAMPKRAIVQAAKEQRISSIWRTFYHPHKPEADT